MINLVIGYYSGYSSLDTDKGGLRAFVESFRKYNTKDLIVVCYIPPIVCEELEEFCEKNNCFLEPINKNQKTGNRWTTYKKVIKKLIFITDIKKILIVDMNDTIFQENPFSIAINDKLYVACEKTIYQYNLQNNNINSLKINTNWINQTNLLPRIENENLQADKEKNVCENNIFKKPVLCAGTILGEFQNIIKLINWGCEVSDTGRWGDVDQGLLNIYVYNYLKEEEYFAPILEESEILTMDSVNFNDLKKDENGFIINNQGEKYKICHQVDRGGNLNYFNSLAQRIKTIQNRNDLLDALPKCEKVAEIGVFKGDYSKILNFKLNPKELHLIDKFEGNILSGDRDGENCVWANLEEEYLKLLNWTKQSNNIKLHKGSSYEIMSKFTNDYFDLIYIDGDHSYSGVKEDLEISFKKIKNEGYISGHDYSKQKFPGVVEAVDEFCYKQKQKIIYLTNDGCPSYLIKIEKK